MAMAEPAPTLSATLEDTPRRLTGTNFSEMHAHLSDGYCVKGLVGRNGMIGIIGPTGSGKTFFATDLAVHIAANRPWRGHQVAGGLVIYAALEGPVSAENRFVAVRNGRGIPGGIPLKLTPGPINLRDPGDVALLVAFIREAESEHGEKCGAVFVDTLSRALSGGDENGPEDMGALIAGADTVRLATGASVFLVHHLGKDESRGARGHSSLKAALDTEIEVTAKNDMRIATVTKQRDLPSGTRFAFRLASVELGRDTDGDAVSSCVVEPVEDIPVERRAPSGKNQAALLAALQEWQRANATTDIVTSIELQAMAKSQGLTRKRLQEATEGLQKFGWLQPALGGFRFLPEASS
jgi:hypothetical protein